MSKLQKSCIAVIGAGAMGRDQCLGIEKIKLAKVVAVADMNQSAIDKLQQDVNLSDVNFYTDAEKLFKNEKLDLVCVATNTNSHLHIAQMAVDANIPRIIVEKPIGNSVTKARLLGQQCQDRNIKLSINQSRRWSDTYAAIKRCIEKGFIGELRQLNMSIGPGGFAMIGSHFIDLAAYLGNSPIAWGIGFLEDEIEPNRRGAEFKDPGGHAYFGLENGIRVTVDLSIDLKRKNKLISLIGSAGRIEIDERIGVWHLTNDILAHRTFSFTGHTKPVGYFTRVAHEILSDSEPSCTAEDAINTLEAIMAVHISHADMNKKVAIPLQGSNADMELAFP